MIPVAWKKKKYQYVYIYTNLYIKTTKEGYGGKNAQKQEKLLK